MWGNGSYGMTGYGYGWGMMAGTMIFWIVLLVVGVLAVIWVLRAVADHGRGTTDTAGGLNILDERFAHGEIDRDEYLRRKHDLLAHGAD